MRSKGTPNFRKILTCVYLYPIMKLDSYYFLWHTCPNGSVNRVARRCFLLGTDPVTGKNFDHRKEWIERRSRQVIDETRSRVHQHRFRIGMQTDARDLLTGA